MQDREDEARQLFERVLSVRTDVGLLAEEYDPTAGRLVGNFPLALSHVSLIGTARNLSRGVVGPSERRRRPALRLPLPRLGRGGPSKGRR